MNLALCVCVSLCYEVSYITQPHTDAIQEIPILALKLPNTRYFDTACGEHCFGECCTIIT